MYDIDFSSFVRELNYKRFFFEILKCYNLNVICFSASLSSISISLNKVSKIIKEKESCYHDFASISLIDMILVYLHKILADISNLFAIKLEKTSKP